MSYTFYIGVSLFNKRSLGTNDFIILYTVFEKNGYSFSVRFACL